MGAFSEQGTRGRRAGAWRLALACAAGIALLLLASSGDTLTFVHRRMLLAAPLARGGLSAAPSLAWTVSGKVGGPEAQLPSTAAYSTAYRQAVQRCRAPPTGSAPLPKLKRAGAWEGSNSSADGNATVVTTLHVDRLPSLEAHCALWPHTIVAAVYAPISSAKRLVCLDEAATPEQLRWGRSWRSWLGLAAGSCQYAGWSLDRLRAEVREVQRRAQETGLCNLRVELYTERVSRKLGAAMGLLPQAALQNRALQALKPEEAEAHHAVVLLDGDMVSVDIWQLVNWPTRWARAAREMSKGRVLVLPAFQLALTGEAALRAALKVGTAEAGKFVLQPLYQEGKAQVLQDRGFAGSQEAALPELWFEAGDMHGADDDGYPALPQGGFAPFSMMLQRHVPWADERIRGSYYQRAWQALAARSMGLQHVVQPNAFALQLPHEQAHSPGEAALPNFEAMEPVFRQLVAEAGAGEYVPVTSFGKQCTLNEPQAPKEQAEEEEEEEEQEADEE